MNRNPLSNKAATESGNLSNFADPLNSCRPANYAATVNTSKGKKRVDLVSSGESAKTASTSAFVGNISTLSNAMSAEVESSAATSTTSNSIQQSTIISQSSSNAPSLSAVAVPEPPALSVSKLKPITILAAPLDETARTTNISLASSLGIYLGICVIKQSCSLQNIFRIMNTSGLKKPFYTQIMERIQSEKFS